MRNFIQKIRTNLHDESTPLRERMTRMCLVMLATIIAMMILEGLIIEHNIFIVMASVIFELFIAVALYIMIKKSNYDLAAILLFISSFTIGLPMVFFTGGGIKAAGSEWYLLAIVTVFVLLRGKPAVSMFIFGLLSYFVVLLIAIYNPSLVKEFTTSSQIYTDFAVSTGLITICIAAILSMLTNEYDQEKLKLEEQNKIIEETARVKDSFFANMSHEIRTPINTIIGLNEMIIREKPSKEIVENAINIQSASKSLVSIINDVLDMSKIETGIMEIVPNQYNVGTMISELVNSNWIRAQEKGIDFKLDMAKDIPSVLYGDESRVKQVVSNIISNAIKYTKEGGVTLFVRSEKLEDGFINLRMAVNDTGSGIKKENLDVLFDVFSRGDITGTHRIEGFGLGLSISKSLVDLMGGKISVDSIYTKGSTFTVSIPQKVIDEKPIAKSSLVIKRSIEDYKDYRQSFEASGAKVLIVDDNAMNLAVAAKLLASTKMQITKVLSGMEALNLTETTHFDVILMDHLMPEMDGVKTLHAIRKQIGGQCLDTPVIALTANAGENAESVYKSYGFQGYLSKPISGGQIETAVFKFLPPELIEYSVSMDFDDRDESLDEVKSSIETEKKPLVITADCTSDIPAEYMENYGIGCMYYNVYIDDKRFRDTLEITSDNMNQLLAAGKAAISLPAEVEEYEEYFAHLLTEAEQVIHFTIGKNAGVAYSVACDAAKCFGNVHIIDSGSITGGIGLLALIAADLLKNGKDAEYILDEIEKTKKKISTSFLLQSAENMYRTGKVSALVYGIARYTHAKPILVMKNSEIRLSGVCLGTMQHSVKAYIKRTFKNPDDINTKILIMNYVGLTVKERESIKKEVAQYIHFENIVEQPASATIAIYCGEKVFSFSFLRK